MLQPLQQLQQVFLSNHLQGQGMAPFNRPRRQALEISRRTVGAYIGTNLQCVDALYTHGQTNCGGQIDCNLHCLYQQTAPATRAIAVHQNVFLESLLACIRPLLIHCPAPGIAEENEEPSIHCMPWSKTECVDAAQRVHSRCKSRSLCPE